jgi:hypothetical protein
MDRERPSRCTEGGSISVHTFISRTLSIHQGLYKVAEAIGTMIQNIKYISIYKYTAEGQGRGGMLGMGFPAGGLGDRVGLIGCEGLLTFDLDDRREEDGDSLCAPQRAHIHTSQMWVLREGWAENTDTHWVCCSSVASLL